MMRLAFAALFLAAALASCAKKQPPLVSSSTDAAPVVAADAEGSAAAADAAPAEPKALAAVDAGPAPMAASLSVAPPTVPAPMVIAGFNVPQPRGFRRAQSPDAIGSPQLTPWLARGDVVLIDEAAFPPGTIDLGFASMLTLPAVLTVEECSLLAKRAAVSESAAMIGPVALLVTGLGPTCSYQLKHAGDAVADEAFATIDGRAFSVRAAHAAGDDKTSAAWSDVVKGMRKTNP